MKCRQAFRLNLDGEVGFKGVYMYTNMYIANVFRLNFDGVVK